MNTVSCFYKMGEKDIESLRLQRPKNLFLKRGNFKTGESATRQVSCLLIKKEKRSIIQRSSLLRSPMLPYFHFFMPLPERIFFNFQKLRD